MYMYMYQYMYMQHTCMAIIATLSYITQYCLRDIRCASMATTRTHFSQNLYYCGDNRQCKGHACMYNSASISFSSFNYRQQDIATYMYMYMYWYVYMYMYMYRYMRASLYADNTVWCIYYRRVKVMAILCNVCNVVCIMCFHHVPDMC